MSCDSPTAGGETWLGVCLLEDCRCSATGELTPVIVVSEHGRTKRSSSPIWSILTRDGVGACSGGAGRMGGVDDRPRTPLLSVGHEAEWAAINREEAEQMRALNMALTPTQRLEQGQRLSQQAVELLAISIRSGHVPRRALWS